MKALLLITLLSSALSVFGASQPGNLNIDKTRSRVDVDVKATVDSFVGKLENYDAQITVDESSGTVKALRFDFRFLDVKTGKDDRDKKMHAWMDTPKNPDGSFVLETLTPDASGLVAKGKLTLHGQTKPISFPVKITRNNADYSFDGEAVVDTREFGLPVIRMALVLKVDPLVKVRFHLVTETKAK